MNSYLVVISFLVLAIIAVGLVAAGFRSFWLKGRRDLVISLGISGMTLLFIFLFGSLIPLVRETEPLRFGFPFLCLMVFPGSQGLTNWARSVRNSEIKKTTRIISLIFLAMAILLQLGFVIKEFSKPYRAPFVGMDSKMVSIRDWLSAHTDRRGRILLEDGGPFTNYFTDSYAAAPLAYYSHRELIGGPHWGTHLTTHFADISGFMLFGRLLPLWDEKSLAEYMNFYNIGWVGAFSAPMKKLFDGYPALFRPIDSVNGFQFYEVNRPKTFFIEGSGTVEADYNRLVLKNVSAPGGRVVLGYHWHPRLRVAPPARVVRVMLGKDPVGFVGIVNPQREMTVKTEYLLGN